MRLLTAGVVLGAGLGGFADGIVLHQIAQWQNMGSAVLPPTDMHAMSRNMAWDGYFHVFTWMTTLAGVYMLQTEASREHYSAPRLHGAADLRLGRVQPRGRGDRSPSAGASPRARSADARIDLRLGISGSWRVGLLAVGWVLMRPDGRSRSR